MNRRTKQEQSGACSDYALQEGGRPLGQPSHIHAIYNEYVGLFNIRTFEMFEGDLPKKAQELVTEWLEQQKKALQEMWDKQVITKLPPL